MVLTGCLAVCSVVRVGLATAVPLVFTPQLLTAEAEVVSDICKILESESGTPGIALVTTSMSGRTM